MHGGPALGLIGCQVLSDEIVYVLDRDPRINNIVIVDNPEGRLLLEKLIGLPVGERAWMIHEDDIGNLSYSGYTVIVSIKPASLHDDAHVLRANIEDGANKLKPSCDSILLFYGLCRSTKYEVQRLVDKFDLPMTFLTEDDGSVADDCFGAILGGRLRYLEMIKNNKGTMFLSPGYAEYWAAKYEKAGIEKIVLQYENNRLLYKTLGYTKVMMLDNGLGDREEFKRRAVIFTRIYDFSLETTRCDMAVFERSYDKAKAQIPRSALVSVEGGEVVFSRTFF